MLAAGRNLLWGVVLVILGAFSAGQARAASIDPQLLKPNLVEVEPGRRLHFACVGKGPRTVVFEQGEDGSITSWRKVEGAVAGFARTCVYDRAGFGLSDPPKEQISGISVGDDLRRVLRAAGVNGPVVLVGHSIGGFYALMFANRYPQQVAGLVLVDPGFPGQFAPSSPKQLKRERQAMVKRDAGYLQCAMLAKQGQISAENPQNCFQVPPDLSPEETAYYTRLKTQPNWYESEVAQTSTYIPREGETESLSWRQERLARRDLGDMPLVVLSAATPSRESVQNDKVYAAFASRWKAGQQALAKRSTKGEWIEVAGSGHDIQLDQPGVVVDAIKRVVEASSPAPAEAKPAKSKVKGKGKAKTGKARKTTR
jgi:pimeloyl-ACP methyl ester carboxylesterase